MGETRFNAAWTREACLVHVDDHGKLWAKSMSEDEEDIIVLERVRAGCRYFHRVPPAMDRARQAVAWVDGVPEEQLPPTGSSSLVDFLRQLEALPYGEYVLFQRERVPDDDDVFMLTMCRFRRLGEHDDESSPTEDTVILGLSADTPGDMARLLACGAWAEDKT